MVLPNHGMLQYVSLCMLVHALGTWIIVSQSEIGVRRGPSSTPNGQVARLVAGARGELSIACPSLSAAAL